MGHLNNAAKTIAMRTTNFNFNFQNELYPVISNSGYKTGHVPLTYSNKGKSIYKKLMPGIDYYHLDLCPIKTEKFQLVQKDGQDSFWIMAKLDSETSLSNIIYTPEDRINRSDDLVIIHQKRMVLTFPQDEHSNVLLFEVSQDLFDPSIIQGVAHVLQQLQGICFLNAIELGLFPTSLRAVFSKNQKQKFPLAFQQTYGLKICYTIFSELIATASFLPNE